MINESQFYDLRSRVAAIESDNPTGPTFRTFDEGRGQTFIPESSGSSSDSYPFKVRVIIDVEEGTFTVTVKKGKWTHLIPSLDGRYIRKIAEMTSDFSYGFDPFPGYIIATMDGSVDIRVDPDAARYIEIKKSEEPVYESPGASIAFKVLGYWDGETWTQWWTGGDIEEDSIVPDSCSIGASDGRKTLGFNPDSEFNAKGVLQIVGANDALPSTKSIPVLELDGFSTGETKFFSIDSHAQDQTTKTIILRSGTESEISLNGADTAEDSAFDVPYLDTNIDETDNKHPLKWAALDSSVETPDTKTIEAFGSGNKRIHLFGADAAEDGAYCMPYLDTTATGHPLAWAAIDTNAASPATMSLEVTGGRVQIHGFTDANVEALATGDSVLMRRSTGTPEVVYADRSLFKGDDGETGPAGPQGEPGNDDYVTGQWDSTDWNAWWTDFGDEFDAKYWPKEDATIGATEVIPMTPGSFLPSGVYDDDYYAMGVHIFQLESAVVELQTKLNAAIAIIEARDATV